MSRPFPAVRRPRKRLAALNGLTIAVVIGVLGGGGLLVAGRQQTGKVVRVEKLDGVLAQPGGGMVNYLLVGSDSRAGADPTDADYGSIGTESDVTGRRSDTIMLMRYDTSTGTAALVSFPRDLYVSIDGGRKDRINSAYSIGPDALVRTIQNEFGVPVNHYIEVDFAGFKRIVDAIGGVSICFDAPTRDLHTGLSIPEAGCFKLNGVQARQYARSRYLETWNGSDWKSEGGSDLGRIERQQNFITAAVHDAEAAVTANPLRSGDVIDAVVGALKLDPTVDLTDAANRLRPIAGGGLVTYQLPVVGEDIDGKSVVRLAAGADAILDYFRGSASEPLQTPASGDG